MSRLQTAVNTMLGRTAPAVPLAVSPWEQTYTVKMLVTVAVPASSREHALAVARSSFHTLRATVVSAQDAEAQG